MFMSIFIFYFMFNLYFYIKIFFIFLCPFLLLELAGNYAWRIIFYALATVYYKPLLAILRILLK